MKLIPQTPKKALKAFLKQKPLRSEIDVFKTNLIALLDKIAVIETQPTDESEEHLKNNLRDFLRDTYYRDTNAINTKDRKDLVIHLGKTTDSEAAVIIEAKRPTNLNEMVSAENPNRKALHELILYYLDERNKAGNIQLKNLVLTNVNEWYIIDANHFDKHIYRNTQIRKLYETKINDRKDNPFFYEEISKIIQKSDIEIPCVYFDIRDYNTILRNNIREDDKALSALFKILSPQHLLKIASPNDSNALNEKFYRELLHIIGLEEAREGTKNIIRRKIVNRNAASLIELVIDAINTEDTLHRLPDASIYGKTREERIFSVALELCITWINRILFLKLLESQLVSYHKSPASFGGGRKAEDDYLFLNTETIHDFDELFKLFHKVLAVNLNDRTDAIKSKYSHVPYLNSSLFEISELEDQIIKINSLDNDGQLELIGTTILKDVKKNTGKLPTLDYLFRFLDAYDFASEGTDEVQEDNKNIINASVLGKVFEKINGYKDGSIFTPGFITMYMCRKSIRLAVMQKFRERYAWTIETFDDLKNYLTDRRSAKDILEFNAVINSLRICDPAVGSGHFLVSSLNELIVIKYELGLLADENGLRISDYKVEIINDELRVFDADSDDEFSYLAPKVINRTVQYRFGGDKLSFRTVPHKEQQRVQKTLFHEKQTIIESCLFGVDINPNSVKICRLRLWIELLKNAYYLTPRPTLQNGEVEEERLETLPNIDINIKCGNSLLSRFALDADLSKTLKSIKYDIEAYRGFVNDYKNEKNRDVKRGLQKIIDGIKGDFRSKIDDPFKGKIAKARGVVDLIMNDMHNLLLMGEKAPKALKEKLEKAARTLAKLEAEKEAILNNVIYKNAFEWRFEFPEVLNNDGEFEGFDIVIGNPPYIDIKGLDPTFVDFLFSNFATTENRLNIYSLFIELGNKILRHNGRFSFINPNSILMNSSYSKIRKLIANNVTEIIKLPDNVFAESDVKVETIIISFIKNVKIENIDVIRYKHDEKVNFIHEDLAEKQSKVIWNIFEDLKFNIYLSNDIQKVISKTILNSIPLEQLAHFTLGITPYDKYRGHTDLQIKERAFHSNTKLSDEFKPLISGGNIQRYFVDPSPKEYLKYGDWLGAPREERFFTEPRVIVRQIVSGNPLRIYAGFTDQKVYFTQIGFSLIPKKEKDIDPKYLTALLNSSLINFVHKYLYLDIEKELFQKILIENCRKFPIKKISFVDQVPFLELVDKILEAKQQGHDTTGYEREIDEMVYKLYELTEEEIKIVEGK
jgi:tRNA1(Val) A37 N6-methylase TrmN6